VEFVRLTASAGDQDWLAAALTQFDCCRDVSEAEDPIAHEINAFLRTDEWRRGAELSVNTTYIFMDDHRAPGRIVGVVALAMDLVRLSAGERERLGRTNFPEFGALRLHMLGVDLDFHHQGIGDELLKWTVGKARALCEEVAFRFVLADVNRAREDWYAARQFVLNRADTYKDKKHTVSMRLDLHSSAGMR
jgi:GNAT superfamily N-acetyltransferase